MKVIKERTYTKKLLSFIIGVVIGLFFYLFIVAMFISSEEIPDKYAILALVLSLLTMVIYSLTSEFNYLKQLEFTMSSLLSNITVYKKREKELASKAEEVIVKFLKHESDIQKSIAASRSGTEKVADELENLSLTNLKVTVENYPNLKSDKHISTILNQIEESQNTILESKLLYNQYVTYYNSTIYSFPANIFSGIWKLKPSAFYEDQIDNDIN
ncbi:LemA family protein [Shimazuella kribbensis]|uniref:LemA family protein n=1 Tax=Shimazuella kribbensis TaxID=139808 RepID=UPI00041D1E88|nr:LemA family protein [Shimazuella kribbensis]